MRVLSLIQTVRFSVIKLLSQQGRLESMKAGTAGFITMADEIYIHLIKPGLCRGRIRVYLAAN